MTLQPGDIRLDDRVALVTGAAAGIGAAVAVGLARFGADVAICDRDLEGLAATARAVEAEGRACFADVLDVRDAEANLSWVTGAAAALGGVDVVVNNVGGGFRAAFVDCSSRAEAALVAENFITVTQTVRHCLPHLEAGASIVNITSIEASRAAPGFAVYAAMKAAVENLTRSLALELAERRVRVNCVAPDVIPTHGVGMLEHATEAATERGDALHPWPDPGAADDVAGAVIWLCSPMARFVTGTIVHVDGGTWAAGGWRRRLDGSYAL